MHLTAFDNATKIANDKAVVGLDSEERKEKLAAHQEKA